MHHRRNNTGFTLVEIALALLVLGIGILSVVALFSSGLDANSKATEETQAALFADNVLNGLRSQSLRAAESNTWESFWNRFMDGSTNISSAAPGAWKTPPVVVGDGNLYTNIYATYAFHADTNTSIVHHALRYKLDVELHTPASTWTTNRANVTLFVWPGEYGATALKDGSVFYSEFNRFGEL